VLEASSRRAADLLAFHHAARIVFFRKPEPSGFNIPSVAPWQGLPANAKRRHFNSMDRARCGDKAVSSGPSVIRGAPEQDVRGQRKDPVGDSRWPASHFTPLGTASRDHLGGRRQSARAGECNRGGRYASRVLCRMMSRWLSDPIRSAGDFPEVHHGNGAPAPWGAVL